ncbi:PREDICTED: F-box protein At2g26160-like [Nicotiana attenuata]|uniref:F-box protein At2g26160-like n=1 Tax=Nicotiana attenuata TaxID=49451 RepID=UPI0009052E65|nr:PREDICTED: F-box protein At2g26160-like [Nicotiana attenuata]
MVLSQGGDQGSDKRPRHSGRFSGDSSGDRDSFGGRGSHIQYSDQQSYNAYPAPISAPPLQSFQGRQFQQQKAYGKASTMVKISCAPGMANSALSKIIWEVFLGCNMAFGQELEYDVLVHVARRLNLVEDYLNFAAVCKPWQLAATKENFNSDLPRVPWLMLAEEEGSDVNSCRKFFNLCNDLIFKTRIPKANGKRCLESMGWLVTVDLGIDGEISLLHPFSGVQIELPHQNTTEDCTRNKTRYIWNFIDKAVLSASPSKTSDYVLMVIEGENKYLSFWRPGDLKWTRIRRENYDPHSCDQHCDVVYFNGKFYAVDMQGNVLVCNVTSAEAQKVAQLPSSMDIYQMGYHRRAEYYILESLGSLLVVVRHGSLGMPRFPFTPVFEREVYDDEEVRLIFHTNSFRVYEVDLAAGTLTETKQIGDRAIFLGANASLSVQASQFPGVNPNCIYFTDDFYEQYSDYVEGGGLDMGIFNIADGTLKGQFKSLSRNRFTPPMWVTPTLC